MTHIEKFNEIVKQAINEGIIKDESFPNTRYGMVSNYSGEGIVKFKEKNPNITTYDDYLYVDYMVTGIGMQCIDGIWRSGYVVVERYTGQPEIAKL